MVAIIRGPKGLYDEKDSILFAAMENGNFDLESFGPLRRRGEVRQLQKEKFPKGKS